MAKELKVTVPDIGDYTDVPVIEVVVKEGDSVEKDAPLVTLESDKATLDVPSPEAGVIKSIKLKAGDKVSKGDDVLVLELEGGDADEEDEDEAEETSEDKEDGKKKSASKASDKDDDDESDDDDEDADKDDEADESGDDAEPEKKKKSSDDEKPVKKKKEKSAKSSGGKKVDVTVPDIGDYSDVPVIEVLVKDGDTVEKDATLLTLESDKATLDVPAPAAGVIAGLTIKVGDKVSKGDAICTLDGGDGDDSDDDEEDDDESDAEKKADAKSSSKDEDGKKPAKKADDKKNKKDDGDASSDAKSGKSDKGTTEKSASSSSSSTEEAVTTQAGSGTLPYASPSIRKFARELGVDLAKVKGSGHHERITQDDVQSFVKKALATPAAASSGGAGIPTIPAVDFAQFGAVETKPLARIRKLSAAHLHRAWLNVPHVTQDDEADITELEAFRKAQNDEAGKDGAKLTLLPFIMKAVAKAIDAYPEFASSLSPDGESLIHKQYRHVGFAADTPNGLVVPVVRDVNKKGIVQLAQETAELAKKARDGKLKGDDMKGGVFSISSLGGIGGSHFTPIVNAPEVGILGVSRGVMKPVWNGKEFEPRLMVPLSLSYDHRVIDGAYAARFIVLLVKLLSDMRRLAL